MRIADVRRLAARERRALSTAARDRTTIDRYDTDMSSAVRVDVATVATDELLAACHRLVPQLSSSSAPLTAAQLGEIVGSPATVLFVARDGSGHGGAGADGAAPGGAILGLLTLAIFRIPTGVRAWIEDVVVDGSARGRGVGEALNRAALDEARRRGARTVDLTSRPSRDAANRLYLRIGFAARDTNVYRFDL